jgi:hypothetical protein
MKVDRARHSAPMLAAVVAVVVAVGLPGCGQSATGPSILPTPTPVSCAAIYQALGLAPSVVADSEAKHQCVRENLQVSGEVSGLIEVAHVQDNPGQTCAPPELGASFASRLAADVQVAGKVYTLTVRPPGMFTGQPLTTSTEVAGAVDLNAQTGSFHYLSSVGTMTTDSSGYKGSLNVDLRRDVAGASAVRIKGAWSCGSPPARPTPNASVPCSSYFAVATQAAVDPSSVPCLPQDITFSGGLSFHIKEAVILPDTGFPPCGGLTPGDQQNYRAKESFAGGGFAYDLDFSTHSDLSSGPLAFPKFGPIYTTVSGAQAPTLTLTTGAVTWTSTAGMYSVASDRKSGTVDMDLVGGLSKNQSVHVSGSWKCGQ